MVYLLPCWSLGTCVPCSGVVMYDSGVIRIVCHVLMAVVVALCSLKASALKSECLKISSNGRSRRNFFCAKIWFVDG